MDKPRQLGSSGGDPRCQVAHEWDGEVPRAFGLGLERRDIEELGVRARGNCRCGLARNDPDRRFCRGKRCFDVEHRLHSRAKGEMHPDGVGIGHGSLKTHRKG